ncbi:hypothetical protein LCGC14_1445580 [marine sediment metagenome]|uniref:HNH nuclease domain-containing protein n=1 Tax=marine sediment metagenome TaxID=412755 RepID=A0A0F9LZW4_9ZZZZ
MPRKNKERFQNKRLAKMKQMGLDGLNRAEIGRRFGVSRELVRLILGNCKQVRKLCLWCDQWFVAPKAHPNIPGCSTSCSYMWRKYGMSQIEFNRTSLNVALNRITTKIAPPNADGCWEWRGYCNTVTGYGVTVWQGKYWSLHRLIYTLTIGEIPQKLCILHHCDNRKCVNPQHLYIGTQADNMRDREIRDRGNRSHRFSPSDIADIRKVYQSNKDLPELSSRYGVGADTILALVMKKTYQSRYPGRLLTDLMVKRVRDLYSGGNHTRKSLAIMYRVSICTMGHILHGRNAYQDIP